MTQKLINIKNMLRIIISLFVIFSFIKSCAKAYTFDDLVNFSNELITYEGSDTWTIKAAQWVVNYQNNIRGYLNSNCNSFTIWASNNSQYGDNYTIMGYVNGEFSSWSAIPYYVLTNYDNTYSKMMATRGGNSWFNVDYSNRNFRYCLFDESIAKNVNFNGKIGNNIYNVFYPPITYKFGHMFSEPYTYNGESIEANTLDYNYRIEYIENVVCEDTIITSMNATINDIPLTCNDLGTYWTLSLSNSTLLKYNTLYHIVVNAIIDGNEETIEEDMIFVVPRNINRKWGYYKTT